MKKGLVTQGVLGIALAAALSGAHAAGDAEAGEVKALPCMGCHGIPGYFNVYPTYHVPRVGGQHPQEAHGPG